MNQQENQSIGPGGNGGDIFIFAREINGTGKIQADGGEGSIGGQGGRISVITDKNNFTGQLSVKGGNSLNKKVVWKELEFWVALLTFMVAVISIPWWPVLFKFVWE